MASFVIYGVRFDRTVVHFVKECKKPTRTKFYQDMAKRFDSGELKRFGFMPQKDFDLRKEWMILV